MRPTTDRGDDEDGGRAASRRELLRAGGATLAALSGTTVLAGQAAGTTGCVPGTLTSGETADRACFTREVASFYWNARALLTVDGTPATEWDLYVNSQSTADGLCDGPFDHHTTVTSDTAEIWFQPETDVGVVVDTHGDDTPYTLELWLCA